MGFSVAGGEARAWFFWLLGGDLAIDFRGCELGGGVRSAARGGVPLRSSVVRFGSGALVGVSLGEGVRGTATIDILKIPLFKEELINENKVGFLSASCRSTKLKLRAVNGACKGFGNYL